MGKAGVGKMQNPGRANLQLPCIIHQQPVWLALVDERAVFCPLLVRLSKEGVEFWKLRLTRKLLELWFLAATPTQSS